MFCVWSRFVQHWRCFFLFFLFPREIWKYDKLGILLSVPERHGVIFDSCDISFHVCCVWNGEIL